MNEPQLRATQMRSTGRYCPVRNHSQPGDKGRDPLHFRDSCVPKVVEVA
jgi:hypothetical protein